MFNVYKLKYANTELQNVFVTNGDASLCDVKLDETARTHGWELVLPAHQFDGSTLSQDQYVEILQAIDPSKEKNRQWAMGKASWFFNEE